VSRSYQTAPIDTGSADVPSGQRASARLRLGKSARQSALTARWEQGKDRPSARYHAGIVNFLGHDPDRDPQEFGQQIRAAREHDGLSRSQLARQLGLSSATVKAWEAGTVSRPSPRVTEIFEGYLQEE